MPALPILCYHKVGTEADEGRRLNIAPARLREHARFFARKGFAFVRARDLAGPWPAKGVCLTFDDAYASTLENGVPALLAEGAVASIYAVTDRVGETSSWDGEAARPLATWEALLQAQAHGFEIGNHTATHARASDLAPERFAEEFQTAQSALAREGLEAASFCYPYGAHTPATRAVLASEGATVALALAKRPALPSDDRLALPRIVVAFSDALPKLLYKLHLRPRLP